MKNNNTKNNNIPINPNSEYIHVWKEKSSSAHTGYRLSPRKGPNMSYLDTPVTGPINFLVKLIWLLLTPIVYIVLLGVGLKLMLFVGRGLADIWINHRTEIIETIRNLFNLI